ncbi:DNA gyrase inhibitor YacG [Geotalea toluenoxydans]|uniref:DNA gyrase inhibitor YacG n=1 Tax=Geotalea toluenoxydans TaxID=421624 RepID=UPI0006D01CA5|nr:DNA gyrase inhibitor YacG [Geotalea toluenoxydans]
MKKTAKHFCPHCQKEVSWQDNPHRPFCSERCKMIDLGSWFSENYKIPGEKKPSEDEEEN